MTLGLTAILINKILLGWVEPVFVFFFKIILSGIFDIGATICFSAQFLTRGKQQHFLIK